MSHDRREGADKRADGFTSLELLVVLAILAIATIIVMPLGGQRHSSISLRSAAFDLAAHLRATRAAAIRNNVEKALTIDVAARQYWVNGQEPRHRLPDHADVEIVIPGIEQIGSAAGRIRFYADGSASGGRIIFRQGSVTALVVVDWLTGNAQLKESL
jgi:general secretion pathway protein H